MRKSFLLKCVFVLLIPPVLSVAADHPVSFDGKWTTKLTCPAKGNTEGYTWQFPSEIIAGAFRGEHGTAGEPGYLLIVGNLADSGSAKLTANGIVASRNYARGVFAHKGADYSYDIKAQFQLTAGSGARSEGLGVIGRPCTFEFNKQEPLHP